MLRKEATWPRFGLIAMKAVLGPQIAKTLVPVESPRLETAEPRHSDTVNRGDRTSKFPSGQLFPITYAVVGQPDLGGLPNALVRLTSRGLRIFAY